jgi:hypothetical protein
MTNAFGVVLDSASLRWAAAEGVPETVIAAVLLLEGGSIDEIVAKLGPRQLEQVIKLVGRSPWCHPPGTLDALKSRRRALPAEPVAGISTNVASARPAARVKPSAEDMRRTHERRLARLRVHAPQSASERALRAHAPQSAFEPERAIERATPAGRLLSASCDIL